jgi:hypothetical protein
MALVTTLASLHRALGIAVEPKTAVGTPVNPAGWLPIDIDGFNWNDKTTWLKDQGLRGSMSNDAYGIIAGVKIAELDLKGPAFGDELGYLCANMFGDAVETGVATTPTGTLTSPSVVGATSVVSSLSIPTTTLIQIDVGVNAEIVTTTGVPTGAFTIPVPALAKAHASGVAITAINAAPITHAFSLLNGFGPGVTSQPSTHTLTEYDGVTPTSGARQFGSTCFSDLTFTFNPETELLKYTAKGMAWASVAAASVPIPTFTASQPVASWRMQMGIGGTVIGAPVLYVESGEYSFKRALKAFYTAQNSQTPYIIQRGGLTADFKLSVLLADETTYNYMANNTQPQLQAILSNGGSGAGLVSFTFDFQNAAFTEAKRNYGSEIIKADVTGSGVLNSTNSGFSGGFGPAKLTLANAIAAGVYG